MATSNQGTSDDTRTIVTVLLLIFVPPVGLILMWVWTKWKLWVKLLVSIPAILVSLAISGVIFTAALVIVDPTRQIQRAKCVTECSKTEERSVCLEECSTTDQSEDNISTESE